MTAYFVRYTVTRTTEYRAVMLGTRATIDDVAKSMLQRIRERGGAFPGYVEGETVKVQIIGVEKVTE